MAALCSLRQWEARNDGRGDDGMRSHDHAHNLDAMINSLQPMHNLGEFLGELHVFSLSLTWKCSFDSHISHWIQPNTTLEKGSGGG